MGVAGAGDVATGSLTANSEASGTGASRVNTHTAMDLLDLVNGWRSECGFYL